MLIPVTFPGSASPGFWPLRVAVQKGKHLGEWRSASGELRLRLTESALNPQ